MSVETNPRAIWLGVAIGIAPGLLSTIFGQGKSGGLPVPSVLLFFVGITLWPVMAVIWSCIRTTRKFGLCMLLGVGLGWLLMITLCGGLR